MKALVTGGAGFIGSNLTDKLLKLGHEVIIIDNLSTGNKYNINPKAEFIEKCLTTLEKDFLIDKGIDIVFHLFYIFKIINIFIKVNSIYF